MADGYNNYGFCPKCGALMRDGVCPSCGFKEWGAGNGGGTYGGQDGYNGGQDGGYGGYSGGYDGRPPKKSRKGLIIAICVTVGVILIGVLVFLAVKVYRRMTAGFDTEYYYEFEDPEGGSGGGDDYWYYYDEGSDGTYVPDEDDSYYEEIVDCTRTDLEYGIVWSTQTLYPDDSSDSSYYYANYPLVTSDLDSSAYDGINSMIEEEAQSLKDGYTVDGLSTTVLGYVTYMEEDMLSVVFKFTVYDDEEEVYVPTLSALTFDMETLSIIEPEDMITIDDDLVLRFRSQDSVQNGGVDFVQDATDEELLELLSDPDSSVFFYSPVGLEAGINYDGGWVTVTLKDQAL